MHRAQPTLGRICLRKVTGAVQTKRPSFIVTKRHIFLITHILHLFNLASFSYYVHRFLFSETHSYLCFSRRALLYWVHVKKFVDRSCPQPPLIVYIPSSNVLLYIPRQSSPCVYTKVSSNRHVINFAGYKRFGLVDTDKGRCSEIQQYTERRKPGASSSPPSMGFFQ